MEKFNRELQSLRKGSNGHARTQNSNISDYKNSLEGLNFRLNTVENRNNELEDRTIENIQK